MDYNHITYSYLRQRDRDELHEGLAGALHDELRHATTKASKGQLHVHQHHSSTATLYFYLKGIYAFQRAALNRHHLHADEGHATTNVTPVGTRGGHPRHHGSLYTPSWSKPPSTDLASKMAACLPPFFHLYMTARHLPTLTSTTAATRFHHHRLARLRLQHGHGCWPPRDKPLLAEVDVSRTRTGRFARVLYWVRTTHRRFSILRVHPAGEPIFYKWCGPPTTAQGVEQCRYLLQKGILSTGAGQIGRSRLSLLSTPPRCELGLRTRT